MDACPKVDGSNICSQPFVKVFCGRPVAFGGVLYLHHIGGINHVLAPIL